MTSRASARASLLARLVLLALLASGCATTHQTRDAEARGFLGDYSELKRGADGDAALVVIGAGVDWRAYDAIMIDSVTIWHATEREMIPDHEAQWLTDFLYAGLQRELSKDYAIVDHPGPGVMRLRAAISEVKGARAVGNTVTTAVPQHRLLSLLHDRTSTVQTWVGRAAIEAELLDSMTNERLAALVDERAGGKTLGGLGGTWKGVERAFTRWAERLRERLEGLRAS